MTVTLKSQASGNRGLGKGPFAAVPDFSSGLGLFTASLSPASTTILGTNGTPTGPQSKILNIYGTKPNRVGHIGNMEPTLPLLPRPSGRYVNWRLELGDQSFKSPDQGLTPPNGRYSARSPMSLDSKMSDLSSAPSSISSKATTPVDVESSKDSSTSHHSESKSRGSPRRTFNVRPKLSIPSDITPQEYARECIVATDWTMLNPYVLHREEYNLLRSHISQAQVTTYLNIRNGILRLWVNNPQIAVTREEAVGCAKDPRWFHVASLSFDWLVRRGHINYGCVKSRRTRTSNVKATGKRQRTIVIIGAGFAGLGCARQLEGLFAQYSKRFQDLDEELPRIVILEGRSRIGGRVYSRPIQSDQPSLPMFSAERHTAEMGGMIITGFERGNPLNILVRGQLKLPYHELRPDTILYDTDGKPVDVTRDRLIEKLYNSCLDRVSEYKFKLPPPKFIQGNRDLMDEGKDSTAEGQKTISHIEEATAALPHAPPVSQQNVAPQVDLVPVSSDRLTGRPNVEPGTLAAQKAAFKAKQDGWALKPDVSESFDINLDTAASLPTATLGSVMDEAITQYKEIVDLNATDFRMINWHIANLEYSNASNYRQLSLQGWDIDTGNEWEGKHTMIIGGYLNVPRGLMLSPTPLDVRVKSPVSSIRYTSGRADGPAQVMCEDGTIYNADYIVNTIPLGVLKTESVKFDPPLPPWKRDSIERLGFGILNKVILVYDKMFWDPEKDFFGVLRNPATHPRSTNQADYTSQRGRFFQWLNVSNTSGVPVLLALMAGDAAIHVEHTSNDDLIHEATEVLRSLFGDKVPYPREAFISRWASDRFACGSYSSAGPNMKIDDYDSMAKPLGNLFFAGEHTTGTHPATVHGAYLSGLRAASEVLDSILGPIEVTTPLIQPKESALSLKRKADDTSSHGGGDPKKARVEAHEAAVWEHIFSELGEPPAPPAKVNSNAYMLYSKAHFEEARKRCSEGRRAGKSKPAPNEVRVMTSKMWKDATPKDKKPYEEHAKQLKEGYAEALKRYRDLSATWEARALEVRKKYEETHPHPLTEKGEDGEEGSGRRRRGKLVDYAESEGSDLDMDDAY